MRLALYGTLMRGCAAAELPAGHVRWERACLIPGRLWDLGEYPGLTAGAGEALGELYRVLDETAFDALDRFEDEGSLYLRRRVRLLEPRVEAWVYFYNASLATAQLIPSGCWRTHLATRGGSQSG